MSLLDCLVSVFALLLMSIVINYDTRRPCSAKLKWKYRVKENSILRKIIKFKDKEEQPCNYFKIIPIYFYLVLSIFTIVFLIIDYVTNGLITMNVTKNVFGVVILIIFTLSVSYYLIVTIWWEVVEYKEMKLTKKEKEEIREIRKRRNKRNKGNKDRQ